MFEDGHKKSLDLGIKKVRLTSLKLIGTYPAQASTGPPSCTTPREPTLYLDGC